MHCACPSRAEMQRVVLRFILCVLLCLFVLLFVGVQFKAHRELVAQQCTIVNNTPLIDIEKNYVHVEGVFEARQRAHRDVARGILEKAHVCVHVPKGAWLG